MRALAATLFWLLAISTSAHAAGCRVFQDIGDKLSFGHLAIGSARKAIAANLPQSPDCRAGRALDEDYCVYTDTDGVTYFVDNRIVVRKEVRDLSQYRGGLIAGIAADDSVAEVVRKLEALPTGFPQWHLLQSSRSGFLFTTDLCLRGSNGMVFDYQLEFDWAGRLISVMSASETYWDVYWATQ